MIIIPRYNLCWCFRNNVNPGWVTIQFINIRGVPFAMGLNRIGNIWVSPKLGWGQESTGNHWSDPDPAGHRAECTAASSDHWGSQLLSLGNYSSTKTARCSVPFGYIWIIWGLLFGGFKYMPLSIPSNRRKIWLDVKWAVKARRCTTQLSNWLI